MMNKTEFAADNTDFDQSIANSTANVVFHVFHWQTNPALIRTILKVF